MKIIYVGLSLFNRFLYQLKLAKCLVLLNVESIFFAHLINNNLINVFYYINNRFWNERSLCWRG